MNILFVCRANRFRSKSSESLFLKYNKNQNIKVKSAGIRRDTFNPYVTPGLIKILKERGANVTNEDSIQLDQNLVDWADKIIISANNVPLDLFPKEKTEVWDINDVDVDDPRPDIPGKMKKSIDKIEKHVKILVKELKNIKK